MAHTANRWKDFYIWDLFTDFLRMILASIFSLQPLSSAVSVYKQQKLLNSLLWSRYRRPQTYLTSQWNLLTTPKWKSFRRPTQGTRPVCQWRRQRILSSPNEAYIIWQQLNATNFWTSREERREEWLRQASTISHHRKPTIQGHRAPNTNNEHGPIRKKIGSFLLRPHLPNEH